MTGAAVSSLVHASPPPGPPGIAPFAPCATIERRRRSAGRPNPSVGPVPWAGASSWRPSPMQGARALSGAGYVMAAPPWRGDLPQSVASRERDLAGAQRRAAAEQSGGGDGVVRGAKRAASRASAARAACRPRSRPGSPRPPRPGRAAAAATAADAPPSTCPRRAGRPPSGCGRRPRRPRAPGRGPAGRAARRGRVSPGPSRRGRRCRAGAATGCAGSSSPPDRGELVEPRDPGSPAGRRPAPPRGRRAAATTSAAVSERTAASAIASAPGHRAHRAVEGELAGEREPAQRRDGRAARTRRGSPPRSRARSPGPALRRSAGARLTVIRFCGNSKPELTIAARTRSRDSRTAASGRPTTANDGRPRADVDLDPHLVRLDADDRERADGGGHRPDARSARGARMAREMRRAKPEFHRTQRTHVGAADYSTLRVSELENEKNETGEWNERFVEEGTVVLRRNMPERHRDLGCPKR